MTSVDDIDAALRELRPDWPPLSDDAKRLIETTVDEAPAMTTTQRMRIARLLRSSSHWGRE